MKRSLKSFGFFCVLVLCILTVPTIIFAADNPVKVVHVCGSRQLRRSLGSACFWSA